MGFHGKKGVQEIVLVPRSLTRFRGVGLGRGGVEYVGGKPNQARERERSRERERGGTGGSLLRLQIRDDIGDVLRGEAELLGAQHKRTAEVLARLDPVAGNQLGQSAGGADDHRIRVGEDHAVDRFAGAGENLRAAVAVCDVRRGLEDRTDRHFGGLASRPPIERGAVLDAAVAQAMTEQAGLGHGGSAGRIALQREDRVHRWQGRGGGRHRDLTGDQRHRRRVVEPAALQFVIEPVAGPATLLVVEDPPQGGLLECRIALLGKIEQRKGSLAGGREAEGGDSGEPLGPRQVRVLRPRGEGAGRLGGGVSRQTSPAVAADQRVGSPDGFRAANTAASLPVVPRPQASR